MLLNHAESDDQSNMGSPEESFSVSVALPYPERAARALLDGGSSGAKGVSATTLVRGGGLAAAWSWTMKAMRKLSSIFPSRVSNLLGMHISKWMTAEYEFRVEANADAVLGFPGASRALFKNNPNALKVFHAVDAHPRAHNEALRVLSPKMRRAETYPAWLVRLIEGEIAAADVVLVPSRVVANQMLNYGVSQEKLILVPYGVDKTRFTPRAESRGVNAQPTILYVGQISQRKNVETLINAAAESSVQLRIVGRVFDSRIVKSLPPNVTLCGVKGRAGLAKEYERADAFAIASREDACSLVVLEAALAGLPVLITAENGASEVLDEVSRVILPPSDVHRWSTAFKAVTALTDEARKRMHNEANKSIMSWTDYAEAVYAELRMRIDGLTE